MDNQTLSHHGVIGMKWGRRRYQNKDGSLTAAGKKRYGDGDSEETKESYEEGKARALKSGSAKDVLKYKGDLTQQEMTTALNRIQWEQNMQSIADRDAVAAAGKSKTDSFFKSVDKATGNVNTALKAWNTAANIYNAFNANGISLPKVDTNITSGNRKERQAEKKEQRKAEEAKKKREEQEAQRESKQKERAEKRESSEKVYEGEVVGGSTSKRKTSESAKRKTESVIIDMEVSDLPATYKDAGRSYVTALLEPPKDDD